MVEQLFDEAFLTDPYRTYAYLRETGRIHWTEIFGGAWLVPHFEDVSQALRHPGISADRSAVPVSQLPEEVRGDFAKWDRLFGLWLLFKDPPRHTRLRRLVNRSFTPRVLESWRPRIEQICAELIAAMEDKGECDFMKEFAYELPASVIAEMLGVRPGDREQFVDWSASVGIFFGTPQPPIELAQAAQDGIVGMADYFADLVPERRRNPGKDILSILLRAEEAGDVLTEEEVLSQMTLFLFAGLDTTKNMLGSGMLGMLKQRGEVDDVTGERHTMHNAVREILRFDSPIQFLHRTAAEDIELCGQEVGKGQTVVLLVGCANRDEERYSRPDVLDLTRDEGDNLAFGFGPHFCLGAPLTYLEGEIAYPMLFERLPGIALASDTEDWDPINPGFRNLRTLPVTC